MISLALFPIRLAVSHDLVTTYEALSPWLALGTGLTIVGLLILTRAHPKLAETRGNAKPTQSIEATGP